MALNDSPLTCWVASDGKIGIDNQCVGLAEALGFEPVVKHVSLRSPWRLMFPMIPHLHPHAFRPEGELVPPWPDVLITGGRAGAAISLFVKNASGGRTFTAQIQNPHLNPARFDVMFVGMHDSTQGKNVVALKGALNRVTQEKIAAAMAQFPDLAALPGPRVAVLVGGANRCYRFEREDAAKLADQLAALAASGIGVMVTASRRTGEENTAILKRALTPPNCFFWDGLGENPLFAMLGFADSILVTADSISMVSEAATTGKPVQVIPLSGGDGKFRSFHEVMSENGITRPFTGMLETWTYPVLNDTQHAAGVVKSLLQNRLVK